MRERANCTRPRHSEDTLIFSNPRVSCVLFVSRDACIARGLKFFAGIRLQSILTVVL